MMVQYKEKRSISS